MKQLRASDARADLYALMDRVAESNEPIRIVSQNNSAILISESHWRGMTETLFSTWMRSSMCAP